MMLASPLAICCMPMATVRSPEPQSWLSAQAVFSAGMPAAMAACRAGFWPVLAVSTWPKITSSTSPGSTLARSIAAVIATLPSSCAGVLPNAPLNAPTGVRAAETITTSFIAFSSWLPAPHSCSAVLIVTERPGAVSVGWSVSLPNLVGATVVPVERFLNQRSHSGHQLLGSPAPRPPGVRGSNHVSPGQRVFELLHDVLPGLDQTLQ